MRFSTVLALGLLAAPASALSAQRATHAGVAATDAAPLTYASRSAACRRAADAAAIVVEHRRPRAWPYVAGGAIAGALVTTGAIAYAVSHSHSDCICPPFVFVPVVVGGAAVGAGAGYVVWRVRR